ncbi:MAG: hypothetical protein MJ158_00690 [Alphaproteobacteria bacterium]|nr:hypothetical protein [Alphaproteobacteria bacterium]
MSKQNRLFIFAGYNKNQYIDSAVVHYISALSKVGDVIAVFDCDITKKELTKISRYCLYVSAKRHGEYDFGSYKRAYLFAKENKLLSKYDFIYFVNDSVYGPIFDIKSVLEKLESFGTDVFGIVQSTHKIYAPIESWFFGMRNQITKAKWFNDFISSVKKQDSKENVTIEYENGFTDLLLKHNISFKCLIKIHGRTTYNKPLKLFYMGNPFIKKNCFIRHNGALGCQISKLLSKTKFADTIIESAKAEYGKKYIDWFLTKNPIKCFCRGVKYIMDKKI